MKKVYIFGTGSTGWRIAKNLEDVEILGVLDNNPEKWGNFCFSDVEENINTSCRGDGWKCFGNAEYMKDVPSDSYDEVIVASLPGIDFIPNELMDAGVPVSKINTSYAVVPVRSRILFLENFSKMYDKTFSQGCCVAEGGVYQGEFAKEINRLFPKRKLYLFDTFEGFDKRDFDVEDQNHVSETSLSNTNTDLVLAKLPHREHVVIRQGYFPETTQDMPDEKFCFVNLDFDLYKPILAGLNYFAPRLVKNGLILIHDYFNSYYPGVSQAVSEFTKDYKGHVQVLPIGDNYSVAIMFD